MVYIFVHVTEKICDVRQAAAGDIVSFCKYFSLGKPVIIYWIHLLKLFFNNVLRFWTFLYFIYFWPLVLINPFIHSLATGVTRGKIPEISRTSVLSHVKMQYLSYFSTFLSSVKRYKEIFVYSWPWESILFNDN